MSKTCKSRPIKINSKGLVAGAKCVNTHIKLSTPEQQGISEVSLTHIRLGRVVPIEGLSPRYLRHPVENEDALALALAGRLHYPETFVIILRAFKLLEKDDVFAWEVEGGRKEVVLVTFFLVVLLIESSLVLFEVFVELILDGTTPPIPGNG